MSNYRPDLKKELIDYLIEIKVDPETAERVFLYFDIITGKAPKDSKVLTSEEIRLVVDKYRISEDKKNKKYLNETLEYLDRFINISGEDKHIEDYPSILWGAILWEFINYLSHKKDIIDFYQKSKDWGEVFTSVVFSDSNNSNEAFIDYLQEISKVKIKNETDLQKITGINYLVPESYKGKKAYPDKDGKIYALKELKDCLLQSRLSRYMRVIERALIEGAKYKDLLQIKPKDWDLPDRWEDILYQDQEGVILYAIKYIYFDNNMRSALESPSLRKIAEDLEAPLSIIIEASL